MSINEESVPKLKRDNQGHVILDDQPIHLNYHLLFVNHMIYDMICSEQ